MTVGELRTIHPDVSFGYNEGLLDMYWVWTSSETFYGWLTWGTSEEMIAAIQKVLNDHGANLDADGRWGPLTQQAWEQILNGYGIASPGQLWLTPEIEDALGLPSDHVRIVSVIAEEYPLLPE